MQPDTAADAIRENAKDLNALIDKIRGLHSQGKDAPKAAARYLAALKAVHELSIEAVTAGVTGPLVEPMSPIPFRDQLVGYSAEARRALEWKAPRVSYPFEAAAPSSPRLQPEDATMTDKELIYQLRLGLATARALLKQVGFDADNLITPTA